MQRKSRVTISVRYIFLSRIIRWTFKITKLVSLCAIFIISSQPFDFSNSWFILCLIIPCKSQGWILTLSRQDTGLFVSLLTSARFFPYKSFLSSLMLCFLLNLHFFLYFRNLNNPETPVLFCNNFCMIWTLSWSLTVQVIAVVKALRCEA